MIDCVCMRVRACAYVHMRVGVQVSVRACVHACMRVCVCVYVRTCVYLTAHIQVTLYNYLQLPDLSETSS